MEVTEFGISMEVKALQSRNAEFPMEVTEFGISMDVKLQPQNASFPIEVTEFGISMEVKPLHLKNAQFPILVNPIKYCSSSKEVIPLHMNTVPISVTAAASE